MSDREASPSEPVPTPDTEGEATRGLEPTSTALDLFHPLIRQWFAERVGTPTDIQRRAWPVIARGDHALITAPTGSGKTLTAFLWALDRLLSGHLEGGAVRVLYISPLKALNADVRRNLTRPLQELAARFEAAGEPAPALGVATRSGDTTSAERSRMLRKPPEILITTPESLNILLTSQGGRGLLSSVETVILDEIHAVVGSKRGTHLMTAIERLAWRVGEVQRIALSATVRPLETVAAFVGGRQVEAGAGGAWSYTPRPVTRVRSAAEKRYEVQVRFPEGAREARERARETGEEVPSVWQLLVPELVQVIRGNRATLVFTNSRRLTETMTRLINDEALETDGPKSLSSPLAYSHHGSLSREVRTVVEERMKRGELPAIVATSSLELGIDVGALDLVVMVQSPSSAASAIQRVGRSGHRVGETSRGLLYPSHGRDFLDAAVVARAILDGDVEPMEPVEGPLDVLAQVVLSMVVAEPWTVEDLHAHLLAVHPYRHLSRAHLELVLEMLAGRYADSRLRELAPRISWDKVRGVVTGRRGADRLIYLSGGTIPDRGYFSLRVAGSNAKVGELDEEFVWERSPGDTFTLGTQVWRIQKITHNDVLVEPGFGASVMAPFWRSDERDRGVFLSQRVGELLERIEGVLEDDSAAGILAEEGAMDPVAAAELTEFLRDQRAACGCLPHRHRLVVERPGAADTRRPQEADRQRWILHTLWGGRVNRPLSLALAAAIEEAEGVVPEVVHDDDCIQLTVPLSVELGGKDLLALVRPGRIVELLRSRLETTGFFGAHFRQNAARALLLPRASFQNRTPLWLNRQRAKQLLEAVGRYGDFPLVLETWRTCLMDEFDLPSLERLLGEVRDGAIEVRTVRTESPSPFAANLQWKETNRFMYADDTPDGEGGRGQGLHRGLLRELVFSPQLRPRVPVALAEELRAKLQRLAPGYAPRDEGELLDWLKERLLIPRGDWRALLEAVERDGAGSDPEEEASMAARERVAAIADRAVAVTLPGAAEPAMAAVERLPRIAEGLGLSPEALELGPLEGLDPEERFEDALPAARGHLAELLERRSRRSAASGDSAGEGAEEDGEEAFDEGAGAADLLSEWLALEGPTDREAVRRVFGWEEGRLEEILEDLVESERVVVDRVIEGWAGEDWAGEDEGAEDGPAQIVDGDHLETLLRWLRSAGRPSFEALPLARLPLFLATHQGVVPRGDEVEALEERLESLLGLALPAEAWEKEVLPARLDPYRTPWLDTLIQETDLSWVGAGEGKALFTLPGELELALPSGEGEEGSEGGELEDDDPLDLFPDPRARWSAAELAEVHGLAQPAVEEELWELAWEARVSSDRFEPVRQAALRRFQPPSAGSGPAPQRQRPARRGGARRLRGLGRGLSRAAGPVDRWYVLGERLPGGDTPDALEREELAKDRARILLDRYGVLFRELVARELPAFQWSKVFRALRLLELSGEVLAGQFFEGVPGLQFATPGAFRRLREEDLPEGRVWWLAAPDPACLAGVDLPDLKGDLPERRWGNSVVYLGERRVAIVRRRGRVLELELAPDHPRIGELFEPLAVALGRDFDPERSITVEEINGVRASDSPYREALRARFDAVVEPGKIVLRRRY